MAALQACPKVSLIMPVFNTDRFVGEAIESVLCQSFTDFELIAIDDGSTDKSAAILRTYVRKDSRVRVVRTSHKGVAHARNVGIESCRGAYVANLDSDDIACPTRLQAQVDFLESRTGYVVVGTRALMVDVDGDPITARPVLEKHDDIEAQLRQGRGLAIVHSSCMFRRCALEEAGGYDEGLSIYEDLDLYFRLSAIGKISNIPATLIKVRRHVSSFSATQSRSSLVDSLQGVLARARKRNGQIINEQETITLSERPFSNAAHYSLWAKLAFTAGNYVTARKYLLRLLVKAPMSAESSREFAALVTTYARRTLRRKIHWMFAARDKILMPPNSQ